MEPVNLESRVVGVIPSAWGIESAESVVAALQAVGHGPGGFDVIVVGSRHQEEILNIASHSGANSVYRLGGDQTDCAAPEAVAHALGQLLTGSELATRNRLLLTPPGPEGEELAAGLAFHLNGQALGRSLSVQLTETGVRVERLVWGGRKRVTLALDSGLAVACLRSGKPALESKAGSASLHTIDTKIDRLPGFTVEVEETGESLPPVESCKLVISGGRGVGEEGFGILKQIARTTEGALGGSLPAVDAGMVPVGRQVGISGKFVNPELYFAVGISGTPQHMAGISTETRIIAVNKDPEAPIFSVAEAGVVGEWQVLLPEVLKALEA